MLAIGGGVGYLLTSSAEVSIPQVENMTEAEARTALKAAKLTVDSKTDEVPSDTIKKGNVVKTSPEAGTMIKKNRPVRLYISSGTKKVTLKDYKGDMIDDVREELEKIGFLEKISALSQLMTILLRKIKFYRKIQRQGQKLIQKKTKLLWRFLMDLRHLKSRIILR